MTSIDVVVARFSRDGGVPAGRLGEAMQILGMKPTEDQDLRPQVVRRWAKGGTFEPHRSPPSHPFSSHLPMSPCNEVHRHLADLGRPKYIDQATFHHFIKDWWFGTGTMKDED